MPGVRRHFDLLDDPLPRRVPSLPRWVHDRILKTTRRPLQWHDGHSSMAVLGLQLESLLQCLIIVIIRQPVIGNNGLFGVGGCLLTLPLACTLTSG